MMAFNLSPVFVCGDVTFHMGVQCTEPHTKGFEPDLGKLQTESGEPETASLQRRFWKDSFFAFAIRIQHMAKCA